MEVNIMNDFLISFKDFFIDIGIFESIGLLVVFLYFIITFLIIRKKFKYKKLFIFVQFLFIFLSTFQWWALKEIAQLSLFLNAIIGILFINKKSIKIICIIYCFIMLLLFGVAHVNYYKNNRYSETVFNKLAWYIEDSLNSYLYQLRDIGESDIVSVKSINQFYLLHVHTKKLNTVHNYLFNGKTDNIEHEKENLIIIVNWILTNHRYASFAFIPSKEDILDILKEKPKTLEKINEQQYEEYLQNIKNSEFITNTHNIPFYQDNLKKNKS